MDGSDLAGVIEYCICMDGGCIVQAPKWETIWSDGFHGTSIARLLRAIDATLPGCSFGLLPLTHGHDSDVVSSEAYIGMIRNDPDSDIATGILSRKPRVSGNFISELEAIDAVGWIRILHPEYDSDGLLAVLAPAIKYENDQHESHVAASTSMVAGGIILRRATVDKSVGLTAMAKKLGFKADKCCAFGDQSNDWGMFRWCGNDFPAREFENLR